MHYVSLCYMAPASDDAPHLRLQLAHCKKTDGAEIGWHLMPEYSTETMPCWWGKHE